MRFKIFFENDNFILQKALKFAKDKHKGQYRKGSNLPYIVHPEIVSELVKKIVPNYNNEMIIAALLHDTIEDTDTSYDEIKLNFGKKVADLVLELTSDDDNMILYGSKAKYLVHKMNNMSSDALTIKLLDRLHNISDIPKNQEWLKKYMKQTIYILQNLKKLNNTHKNIIKEIIKTIQEKIDFFD